MAKTFKVEIVTPEETALSADATALQAPAWEGYLGVLAGHAPLLAALTPGVLTVRDEAGKARHFAIRGGFMEVSPARVVVLADAIERAEDVDAKAAERELDEASSLVAAQEGETMEARRKLRELALEERESARRWAEARLHALERMREAS